MRTIADIRKDLLAGTVSVADIVEKYLGRAEETQDYGAFLEVFDDLEEQAAYAQKILDTKGENSPLLTGIPIAFKDNILIHGREATSASKILEGYRAPYDATVTKKLRAAGAIFFGRTNMDEFAMGASTEHSAYQKTKNPHDSRRVPGGSSGGSAAAVGLGSVPVALGSDTAGSIRQPAAFCGVVGLKPTYGAVSRYGLMALGSSLDTIGPLATSVADAETLFSIIAGMDSRDSTTQSPTPVSVPKKMKVGIPRKLLSSGVDADVLGRFEETVELLQSQGHSIVDIELATALYGVPVYYIIMPAEASANLARYDGIRFGIQEYDPSFNALFSKTRTKGFGPEVKRRILLGTYVLSSGYIDAYYNAAQKARRVMQKEFVDIFSTVDVIALPTTPAPAFEFGKRDNPLSMYLEDIFTVFANLTGQPALSVPMGTVVRNDAELPVGIQFIAPHFGEQRLFTIGKEVA